MIKSKLVNLHVNSFILKIVILVSVSTTVQVSEAFACGGVLDIGCNLTHGGLSPGNIIDQTKKAESNTINTVQKAGQDVANAVDALQANLLTGPILEQAILASHNTAINGSMPIPPLIRQELTGYASEDSMNRVRYKIGDNGFANLAHLLEQGGTASAVTLIDVIVFNGPTEAQWPALWAHELTHVDQYRAWGVHNFAVQYTQNWHSIENPAYDKEHGFPTWQQQHQGFSNVSVPAPNQAVGAFCYAAGGRYGPGLIQSQGAPCSVTLPQGVFWGQVGP